MPSGNVWAVQAFPATNTFSLLDGKWHLVTCVRRWSGTTNSQLELWTDNTLVDIEISDVHTNMPAMYWNTWSGYPQAG